MRHKEVGNMKTDTIAAISTAMTASGIGIVRMSGSEVFTIIDRVYQSKGKKKKLVRSTNPYNSLRLYHGWG